MPVSRCPYREDEAEAYLREHGRSSRSQIAAAMGLKPGTVAGHLNWLRHDGRAHNSGMGAHGMWEIGPANPTAPVAKRAIEQASSVWDYAARIK